MLEIYVHGTNESGFIDLFPGTKLQMEQLTEIWDEDFGAAVYSLPVEAPWTDGNKRKFNFAERLQNDTGTSLQTWRVDVISDGMPIFYDAVITMLEKNGELTYARGKSNFTISGNKGLLGNLIKNKTLRDLYLGGVINMGAYTAREFATLRAGGTFSQYSYVRFVPMAIEQYIDTGRPDYNNEFLALDTVNNVVINSGGTAWEFGRPDTTTPTTAVAPGVAEYMDYRTIPFFTIKYLLQQLFIENGYQVTGDFITSTDFDDLLLFNNYSLEVYDYTAYTDLSTQILPANHVPATLLSDFIKAVCMAFNMYPAFLDGRTVELRYRRDRIKQRRIFDVTNYCAAQFISQVSSGQSNGYTLQYAGNGDSYLGGRVQDITTYTLAATVAKKADLDTIDIGRDFTTADIAFVVADDMYYRVADATASPVLWDAFSEKLDAYIVGDGSNSLDIPISPLATYVKQNETTGLMEKQNFVGASMKGSYAINNRQRVTNSFDLIFFYGKMYTIDSLSQPISFNNNRDADNNKIVPYSLSLWGDDGIYANFYPEWIAIKTKNELVRVNVRVDEKLITLLNVNDFVMIYNVQLMIYKLLADYPVSNNPTAELQAYVV